MNAVKWLLFVLLIPSVSFCQKNFTSLGAELGLPSSQDIESLGTGFGGSFRVEGSWSKHVSGIATLGYVSFAKGNSSSYTLPAQLNVVPIQFGIKYYLKEKIDRSEGLFISGELGYMFATNHITFTDGSKESVKESGVSSAIGFGYQYKKLEAGFRLQFNLAEKGFNIYYSNFRVAYCFQKKPKS